MTIIHRVEEEQSLTGREYLVISELVLVMDSSVLLILFSIELGATPYFRVSLVLPR